MLKKFGGLGAAKKALDDTLKDIEETDKKKKKIKKIQEKIGKLPIKEDKKNYETNSWWRCF